MGLGCVFQRRVLLLIGVSGGGDASSSDYLLASLGTTKGKETGGVMQMRTGEISPPLDLRSCLLTKHGGSGSSWQSRIVLQNPSPVSQTIVSYALEDSHFPGVADFRLFFTGCFSVHWVDFYIEECLLCKRTRQ